MRTYRLLLAMLAGVLIAIALVIIAVYLASEDEPSNALRAQEACSGVQTLAGQDLASIAETNTTAKTFCVGDGNYSVTRPIKVQSGDEWIGVYADSTRPTISSAGVAKQIFDATGANGILLRGLTARDAVGDTTCQPDCGRGISGGTNVTLENVRATANANQGVGGAGSNLIVRDSVFDANGSSPFYADGTYASAAGIKTVNSAFIYSSRASDNAWIGFWCDLECNTFEVHDSVASGNGKGGIFYEVSTGPAIFEGNTIQNNGYNELQRRPGGLLMVSSRNADAYGNTFGGNFEYGVRLTEDEREPVLGNIRFHDNTMNGDATNGCSLSGVTCQRNR